jgi:hypothetical protein
LYLDLPLVYSHWIFLGDESTSRCSCKKSYCILHVFLSCFCSMGQQNIRKIHFSQSDDIVSSQHSYACCLAIKKMAKTRTTPCLKWNSNSAAHKMLVAGLLSGTIDPSRRPKELWESNPEFGRYSLDSFHSAYHQNKHSTGTFMVSKSMCLSCLPASLFLTTTLLILLLLSHC